MKDKLNTVKTVLCAVFAAGCAVLGFFFWDASDRAGSLLEENDALREQLSVTQSDAKNAAAAAYALGLADLVKFHRPEKHAVVRQGQAVHPQLLSPVGQIGKPSETVEEAVFAMDM